MKTSLKSLVLAQSIAAAVVAFGAPATSMAAVGGVGATPQNGATCPTNSTPTLSGGVLLCRQAVQHTRGSICSAAIFQRNGDITLNVRVEMLSAGSDLCRILGGAVTQPSQMTPPLPGMPADSAFTRQINASGVDTFTATTFQYVFPAGAVFVGDASHGVRCPSGFSAQSINSGRGMRCFDEVVKRAGCDIGWSVERRSGVDRCTSRDFLGNLVIGQYTIPENAAYVGLMGNPGTNGWNLDADRIGHGSTDYWVQRDYRYAESF